MGVFELYDSLLENSFNDKLIGIITFDDDTINWEYDGLWKTTDNMENHLIEICDVDKELIADHLSDNNILKEFYFIGPEINDSFISIQILEK